MSRFVLLLCLFAFSRLSAQVHADRATVSFVSNVSGTLSINGVQKYALSAGLARKITLLPGEHYLTLEATVPCAAFQEELFTVTPAQMGQQFTKAIHISTSAFDKLAFQSIEEGSLELMKTHFNCGVDVNARNKEGVTLLHKAATKGDLEIVRFLIAKGANVNAKSAVDDSTPLHSSVYAGRKDVARLLLDKGAEVNAKTRPFGDTPLKIAIEFNQPKVAEVLKLFGGKKE